MGEPHKIVEGISGVWHYHLARAGDPDHTALCGARTMSSGAPISSWGFRPEHMPTSYCHACADIAGIDHARKQEQGNG